MDERKWTKLKISLKNSIGENNFNNWLSPVEFSHINEDVAFHELVRKYYDPKHVSWKM